MIGPPLIALILAAGIFLTIRLNVVQVFRFGYIFRETLGKMAAPRQKYAPGEITPFQALSTALAATVGTGNIAGVATALFLGGPGAIFWMWVSAFFGMATKFAEVTLAVHFREKKGDRIAGGPMYYLKNGLNLPGLALLYAFFGALAAFGIGNLVQANSVADAVQATFGFPPVLTGLALALVGGLVILGGIKRIALIASTLVPIMAISYFASCLYILIIHASSIPPALAEIVAAAFHGRAAAGGVAGATVFQAWRFGISRGIFTNEAGLGSASIAHAAAQTTHPARQGLWGVIEVFIDTHVICTVTALVLLVTGAYASGLEGAAMTAEAFSRGLPGEAGQFVVSIGLSIFAFTTVLSWSYYGEKCFEYILGSRYISIYRITWILFIVVGALGGLRVVWALSDILNGLMAFPNLVGLVGLSGLLARLSKDYFTGRSG